MAVSKRLRYEILRRDNHACRYCGACAPDAKLTVDHVVPTALGGGDDPSNLVTACVDCNSGKSASSPDAPIVADVAADALRWAKAMEFAYYGAIGERVNQEYYEQQFWTAWHQWRSVCVKCQKWECESSKPHPLPADWWQSLHRWLQLGLEIDDLEHSCRIALSKRGIPSDERWRYFCGVAWKQLTERQQAARCMLDAGQVD